MYRRIESQLKETGKITTGSKEEEPLSTVPGTCIIYQLFYFASNTFITETENIVAKNECGPMISMYIAVVAIRS